jgi:hypothetical protein
MKKLLSLLFVLIPVNLDSAVYFTNTQYATTGKALSSFMPANEGTVMCWAYAITTAGTCADGVGLSTIFSDTDNSGSAGGFMWFGFASNGVCAGGFSGANVSILGQYVANTWVHIAWVHRAGSLWLYKNGQLLGSFPFGNVTQITHLVTIGNSWDQVRRFNGYIDDLRVYNRGLSAQEIESIYKSHMRVNMTNGKTAHWRMDDGKDGQLATNSALRDSSNSKFNAVIVGSPTWKSTILSYP